MQTLKLPRTVVGVSVPNLLLSIYLLITINLVSRYFLWDFTVYIGLILAPLICTIQGEKRSLRYLIPAVLSAGFALMVPVNTTLFLSLLFVVLLLIENLHGKISLTLLFLMLLISPIFKYISQFVSFPIRLWLSEVVAQILTGVGLQATASGNIIEMNGYDFSVDQACAGLQMLSTSFIICLFIVAFYQKKVHQQLSFWKVAGYLLFTFALNIGCNLTRIVILVLFKIMPSSLLHDLVGLICLVAYVVLPLLLISNFHFKRFPITKQHQFVTISNVSDPILLRYTGLHVSLFIILLFITFNIRKMDKITRPTANNVVLSGFKKDILESTVVKFKNKEALIYFKPSPFYAPEHNPMICWTGSGYEFKHIKKETLDGKEVYTAVLVKGNDKIYSTWWFDNGKTKTINQFMW
ncbi:MAG: exosortase, partial [Daejeonella sp.]|nr:exosortase [Daejeonella sp.]